MNSLLSAAAVAFAFFAHNVQCAPAASGPPTVQLSGTTVTGQAFPQFGLEFFGGELWLPFHFH